MEASSVCNHSIVPEPLDDSNYEIWSSCMGDYLLSQDLWDVVEEEPEPAKSSPDSLKNNWRKKNASALYAIKMSCTPNILSQVVKVKTAKEAWDLLAATPVSAAETDNHWERLKWGEIEGDDTEYKLFTDGVIKDDVNSVEEFINSHPHALSAKVFESGRTALHYALNYGQEKMAVWLVNRMTSDDLEVLEDDGCTALSRGANIVFPGLLQLLELMVKKNPNLPNIGTALTLPVVIASWKGFKDSTRFLFHATDPNILSMENGKIGLNLLIDCINMKLLDVATELVEKFPGILEQDYNGMYPTHAFAKTFSALPKRSENKKSRDNALLELYNEHTFKHHNHQARAFLKLICNKVSTLDSRVLLRVVGDAMIEAASHGNIDFINEMLRVNPFLIWSNNEDKTIFWYAVVNRQPKVFNLIYDTPDKKESLLSCSNKEDNNNILHFAAMLAPSSVLDRTSGPALQMQQELKWFKEVYNVAKPRYREDLNKEGLTPQQLFSKSHKKLIEDGEKSMKDIAQSATTVGALIVTMMFAAAFTVPGGNNQDTGLPLFLRKVLFKIFIICDALSLFSSTASVLVFLGVLTSRYGENDFLLVLPWKLMIGLSTLFFSITTLMVAFCAALAIMLDGQLQFILPIVLIGCVPIILFLSSILPLLYEIFISTFGPSVFDKNTKFPCKKEAEEKIIEASSVDTELPNKKGQKSPNIISNPLSACLKLPDKKEEEEEEGKTTNNTPCVDQIV